MELASHYDLTISQPLPVKPQMAAFNAWLAEAAAERGLSCALLHEGVVEEAICRLDEGQLTIGLHLDYFALWNVFDDPYARLSQAVQDANGEPINLPCCSRLFTDKSVMHLELVHRGLGVPETLVIRPWTADRPLRADEHSQLHLDEADARVYIKPANGFGCRGVVRADHVDAASLARAIRLARDHDRRDAYLVQREIVCSRLTDDQGVERPAYWRVLYCLGELIPFWWCKGEPEHGRPSYRRVTTAEIRRHQLQPVLAYVRELAEITRLQWFSTELCLSEGSQQSRYRVRGGDSRLRPVVAIDYVNDQCDVDVQSRWLGAPPDDVIRHVAERFVEAARAKRNVLRLASSRPQRVPQAA
jgi:hypothetical protein